MHGHHFFFLLSAAQNRQYKSTGSLQRVCRTLFRFGVHTQEAKERCSQNAEAFGSAASTGTSCHQAPARPAPAEALRSRSALLAGTGTELSQHAEVTELPGVPNSPLALSSQHSDLPVISSHTVQVQIFSSPVQFRWKRGTADPGGSDRQQT